MRYSPETLEKQESDAKMIFKQITSGDFPTLAHARGALATLYNPDATISRSGISRALGMLKVYYSNREHKRGRT